MTGNDVFIMQSLLLRDTAVSDSLLADGKFTESSDQAVSSFQKAHRLRITGVLDYQSAQLLLDLHSADGYTDSNFTAASMGYLYKLHVPVYRNRSQESDATLFDANNNVLLTFRVRAHGHRDDGYSAAWPDFGDGDVGLNEFTSCGNTVTGLWSVDLNSPEPDPDLYGPWPINRFVAGISGNAALLAPNIRDGILLHTGNWYNYSSSSKSAARRTDPKSAWTPSEDMPNSSGCLHGHPEDVERVYQLLLGLGVVVNPNTYSGQNYPYKPQGVAVVQLVD